MALRGDSIDNIPGAPGIGDKGSVELIQQFGTVEAALDAAVSTPDLIKRKTYRESLQNNRDNILLSKELVTIHTSVPIEFALDAMRTQPVDNAACRDLFTELEFTTLLNDLAPDLDRRGHHLQPQAHRRPKSPHSSPKPASPAGSTSPSLSPPPSSPKSSADPEATAEEAPEPPPAETMSLFGALRNPRGCLISPGSSPRADVDLHLRTRRLHHRPRRHPHARHRSLPRHPRPPRRPRPTPPSPSTSTTSKPSSAPSTRTTSPSRGPITDVMLQSYLLNPTHASHTLPDIAARTTSIALTHQPTKDNPSDPKRLPEAAAAIARLATTLNQQLTEVITPHATLTDDPSLGGAVTVDMLFADTMSSAVPWGARLQVAAHAHVQVQPAVARQQVQHVVEEAHAGRARAPAGAVEAERQLDVGLARAALDRGGAAHGSGFSPMRASIERASTEALGARDRRPRGGQFAHTGRVDPHFGHDNT